MAFQTPLFRTAERTAFAVVDKPTADPVAIEATPPVPVPSAPSEPVPTTKPVPTKLAPAPSPTKPAPIKPSPSGTTEPAPEPVAAPVTTAPEPAGTASAAPTVKLDSDVSVFLVDGSGRRADLGALEPGRYTVAAVFDPSSPDDLTEIQPVTLAAGDTLSIKCVGSARRCKVTR